MKKPLPVWAIVASVVVALGFVVVIFAKGASGGEASKDELTAIRNNQRNFSNQPPVQSPGAPPAVSSDGRGGMPLASAGAPPGGVVGQQ